MRFQEQDEWSKGEKTTDYYQRNIEAAKNRENRWKNANKVIHPEDMPWDDCPQGRLKYLLNDDMNAVSTNFNAYIQEIPPGSRSGKHRHMAEEVLLVLEGSGYDLHWDVDFSLGVKYEWHVDEEPKKFSWETGDLIVIPVNTVHQHFNTDPERPVRLLSTICNIYKFLDYDDLEQLEDAPGTQK